MNLSVLSAQIKRHLSCPIQKIFLPYVRLTSFFHAFGICFDQKRIIQLNQIIVLLIYAQLLCDHGRSLQYTPFPGMPLHKEKTVLRDSLKMSS